MKPNLIQEAHSSEVAAQQMVINPSFAAVATTEAHALTYIGMCLEQGPFSRNDMWKLFTQAQGSSPAWIPASNLNFSYAEDRFVPSGLAARGVEVRKLWNRKGPVEVAVVEPIEDSVAIATCGRLLDYSLLAESMPLRTIFGESRESVTGQQGAIMRRKILSQLDAEPGLSEVELARRITGNDQFPMSIFLLDFYKNGVVVRQHSSDWDNRTFRLTGRGVPMQGKRRYDINSTTTALYNATDILAASGNQEVTARLLFDFALQVDPEVDTAQLRQAVGQALAGGESYEGNSYSKFLQSVEAPGSLKGGELTKYEINPTHRDSLHSMLDDLDAISVGNDAAIDYWKDRAVDIYADSDSVNRLALKAASSSPHKNNLEDNEFIDKITELVSQRGPSTVKELESYLRENGIIIGLKGLDGKVRRLTKAGRLDVAESPLSNRNTRRVKRIVGILAVQSTSKD